MPRKNRCMRHQISLRAMILLSVVLMLCGAAGGGLVLAQLSPGGGAAAETGEAAEAPATDEREVQGEAPAVEAAPAAGEDVPADSKDSPAVDGAEDAAADESAGAGDAATGAEGQGDSEPEEDEADAAVQALTHYGIAREHLQGGRLREAIAAYKKAAQFDPKSLTIKMELAAAQLAVGDRGAAKSTYEDIIAQHDGAAEAHFQLARMALGVRDQATAGGHFEKVLKAAEDDKQGNRFYPLALYYLALTSDERGQSEKSAEYFHRLVDWLSNSDESFKRDREVGRLLQILPQLVAKTAQVYLLQGQAEKAVAVVRDSAPQMLGEAGFGAALVRSLLDSKHSDLALEVALLVQAQRPNDAASYELVAHVFESREDDDAALVGKLRELIAAHPDNPIIQLVLGERLLESDVAAENDEALKLIETVIARMDGKADVAGDRLLRSLIDKLLERKRADLALSLAEAIRRKQPAEIAPYYLLERIHEELGGQAGVAEAFKAYLDEGRDMSVIRLILGKALLALPDRSQEGLELLEPLTKRASGVSEAAREVLVGHFRKTDQAGRVVRLLGQTVNEQYDQGAAMYRLLSFLDTLEDKQELYAKAAAELKDVDRNEALGVHFILGLLSEMDDPDSAAVHYQKAVDAQEKFLLGYERLSALYMRQDRLMNALDTLRNALYAGSQGGVFFRRMGTVYELVDRDIDAIATYRTAMRLDRDIVPAVQYRLANVLARIGQADEGLKLLREATVTSPGEIYTWYNLARYQMERKQSADALATIDKAMLLMPESPQLKYVKASFLLQDRQYDAAQVLIDELNGIEELNDAGRGLQVSRLIYERKYDAAEKIVQQWLEEKPENLELLLQLSSIKHVSGDNKASEDILLGILDKHPRNSAANNDLGYMWADRGHNVLESERMIRKALQEDPENSAFLDSLGWALYKQGRIDEALVYLRRSVRIDNNTDPIVYDHLADALVRVGRTDEARKYYEQARRMLEEEVLRPLSYEHGKLQEKLKAKFEALDKGRPVPVAEVVPPEEQQLQQQRYQQLQRERQQQKHAEEVPVQDSQLESVGG